MGEKRKRITVEIDESKFYLVKEFCLKNKITMRILLTQLIEEKIEKQKNE